MELRVKLTDGATLPSRAHPTDAGADLFAPKSARCSTRLTQSKGYGLTMKHNLTDSRTVDVCVHESESIADTLCNGCLCLEVRVERRRRGEREKYWCQHQRGYFDPHAVTECNRRITHLEKQPSGKFNGGYNNGRTHTL